jgi:hypothetical protein
MNNLENDTCTRDDLQVVIDVPSYWGVDENGHIDYSNFCGDGDADADNVDSYYCDACDENFEDWADALAHLEQAA